jgi:hypothetical protein
MSKFSNVQTVVVGTLILKKSDQWEQTAKCET